MPDYILARIADAHVKAIRKLIANAKLYNNVVTTREVDYNFEYKLQEGEWFKIVSFSRQDYFMQWLNEEFVPTDFERLQRDEYKKIKWLVGVQNDGNDYYFQRVTPTSVLKNRKFINIREDLDIIEHESLITINNEPDAIYYKQQDLFLFKEVSRIRPIFPGVETLYREATDIEINEFLSLEGVVLKANFTGTQVSIPNRKRITKAIEQYRAFTPDQKNELKNTVREYCPHLLDANDNYSISNDDNVKSLVYAIDQRFFTSVITREKKVATSVELIN